MTEITEEQNIIIRQELYKTLQQEYKKFVDLIRSMPIKQEDLRLVFENLDTGMLWAKEIIQFVPFTNVGAPIEPAVPAEVESVAVADTLTTSH